MENLINKLEIIDTSSLVNKVEMNLKDLLIKKNLKVGSAVPPEVELAGALGLAGRLSGKRWHGCV